MAVRTPDHIATASILLQCLSICARVHYVGGVDDATDGARDDGSGVDAVVVGDGALASVA